MLKNALWRYGPYPAPAKGALGASVPDGGNFEGNDAATTRPQSAWSSAAGRSSATSADGEDSRIFECPACANCGVGGAGGMGTQTDMGWHGPSHVWFPSQNNIGLNLSGNGTKGRGINYGGPAAGVSSTPGRGWSGRQFSAT